MAKKKNDSPVTTPINEETGPSDRLSLLKSRLRVAQAFCKKPHAAWKKWIAEYEIDDLGDTEEIRDKVRIGYIFRKTETELPAIFDDQPDLFIKGRSSEMKALEPGYNALYDYLWDIQRLEEKIEDAGTYFVLLGMAFMASPWVTKNKTIKEMQPQQVPMLDEMGQPVIDMATMQPSMQEVMQEVEYEVPIIDNPDAKLCDPFKIYFSPETKFNLVLDYEHCPYYFYEEATTKEAIKAEYSKDVDPNERLHVGDSEIDGEIDSEMKEHKDDFKRVTKYHYYGVLPEDMAKGIEGEPWRYDKDYHIIFTSNEELKAEELQYEVKPCFALGNYGLANKFFKFGDAKHLMPLVQELEQYRSQILKHTRKMANPKPLIEASSEVDEKAFTDSRPGKSVTYTGTPPSYLSPANLGSEVGVGVDMVRTDLEKTAPSFDLSGGGGQSQVKTPRGIAVYSEASDKGARRKRKKVARFIRQLLIFQFGQIGDNWDAQSMGKIGLEDTVDPELLLQTLQDPNVLNKLDIEVESLSVNRVQMRQDALDLFDLAAQHPDLFNLVEIAKDVLQNGFNKKDADRYMISQQEMMMQAVQQFIQALGQQNPELAAQVMAYMQNPNMMALMQQGQPGAGQGALGQPPAPEPPQDPGMPPMGPA